MKAANDELKKARELLSEFQKSDYKMLSSFELALEILQELASDGSIPEKQLAYNIINSYIKKLFGDGYHALKIENGEQCSNIAKALTTLEGLCEDLVSDKLIELHELRESLANKWRERRKESIAPLDMILDVKEYMILIGTPINVIESVFTDLISKYSLRKH